MIENEKLDITKFSGPVFDYRAMRVSDSFNCVDQEMHDSDCSEDYDNDLFYQQSGQAYFHAINQAKKEQIAQQAGEDDSNQSDHNNPEEADVNEEQLQTAGIQLDFNEEELTSKRQTAMEFQIDENEVSLIDFLFLKQQQAEKCKLRTSIDAQVSDLKKQLEYIGGIVGMRTDNNQEAYSHFFNYELNTVTWRTFVNKMILQTYHRLMIEKQLKEVKKLEKDLREKIQQCDDKIADNRRAINNIRDSGSGRDNGYSKRDRNYNRGGDRNGDRGGSSSAQKAQHYHPQQMPQQNLTNFGQEMNFLAQPPLPNQVNPLLAINQMNLQDMQLPPMMDPAQLQMMIDNLQATQQQQQQQNSTS